MPIRYNPGVSSLGMPGLYRKRFIVPDELLWFYRSIVFYKTARCTELFAGMYRKAVFVV